MTALAPLAVAIPLIGSAALAAAGHWVPRRVADLTAIAAASACAVLCLLVLLDARDGTLVYWFGKWHPVGGVAIGVGFAIDMIGAGLAAFIALLMILALIYCVRYIEADEPFLQILLLVFLAGMVGFCFSGDLFNMFVFFELMSVAAFALAGYKIEQAAALEGSLNFAVTNTIGSFLILIGIGLTYGRTGALNLAQIGVALGAHPADGLVVVAFVLITCGFLVKAAIVPFHFWLADAYAVAPTPVCLLFAGAMSELGLYGVGRIYFAAFHAPLLPHEAVLTPILVAAGAVTALLGAVMAFAQDHLKRMLAFATISYMGIFLAGLALFTPDGIAGAAVFVVADGCAKAALFAAVGIVQHRCGMVRERNLRGRGRDLRWTGWILVGGGLLFAALPPFGTFLGKSMIDSALSNGGYDWMVPVVILTSALTGAAVLRASAGILLGWGAGPARQAPERFSDDDEGETAGGSDATPAVMWVPAALLLAAAVAVGVWPGVIHAALDAATGFTDHGAYAGAVLGHPAASLPVPAAHPPAFHDYVFAAISTIGALGLALLALGSWPQPRGAPEGALGRAVERIRALHTGHVGDYVAWLVVGVAAFGAAFALAIG